MKNHNDLIGIRTHDIQACSAVLKPTTPPHAPQMIYIYLYICLYYSCNNYTGIMKNYGSLQLENMWYAVGFFMDQLQ
jgi:hypothetical protein